MAVINVRAFDASRNRLDDHVDVDVQALPSRELVRHVRNRRGTSTMKFSGLKAGQVYAVQVFPARHRPVGAMVRAPHGAAPANVHVFCPVHPLRVSRVRFPAWAGLPAELTDVLDGSVLESDQPAAPDVTGGGPTGRALYDALEPVPRAGLLNLFCKMQSTVAGDRAMWEFVRDVYRVRGDRIFANVDLAFRDHVKTAASAGDFRPADDSLHTPPPGFVRAGSFKHQFFQAGVLQLTFFASVDGPLSFKVDADIDDAGGLGHVFQVLRNWLTQGDTSPYDIHQILTFHQLLDPGYALET